MAVTGRVDPDRLLRNDAGRPGQPLSLTKPLGLGVLNSRHKATGEVFEAAVAAMTTLHREAAEAAVTAGLRCAPDGRGFGLLRALLEGPPASGVHPLLGPAPVAPHHGPRPAPAP